MQQSDRTPADYLPLLAALWAAVLVLLALGGLPPRRSLSSAAALYLALRTVVVCTAVALLTASMLLALIYRRAALDNCRILLSSGASVAGWTAALYALLLVQSPWSLAAAVGLLIAIAAFRRRYEAAFFPSPAPAAVSAERTLISVPAQPRLPVRSLLGGLSIQTGLVCVAAEETAFGALFFSLGAATLIFPAYRSLTPPRIEPLHRTATRAWNAVSAAALVLLIGLFPYIQPPPSFDSIPGTTPVKATGAPSGALPVPRGVPSVDLGDTYAAIVLWPEQEPKRTLLVPPLPSLGKSWNIEDAPRTTIPFYGVYWFLRPPDQVPGDNAVVLRGDPVARSFRATGNRPLIMVAHQNLGRLIPLACCSKIEVAFDNIDRYPGSVALELALVDTTLSPPQAQPLGRQDVASTPLWRPGARNQVSEVLTFPIPPSPAIRSFDQFSIRFSLGAVRADKSARMALRRFTLLPR